MGHRITSMNDITPAIEAAFVCNGLLLADADLGEEFFNLRTGLAGELFQKFVNFRLPLAVVIPHHSSHGDRFSELVHEHRSHPLVRFFPSTELAAEWLKSQGAVLPES